MDLQQRIFWDGCEPFVVAVEVDVGYSSTMGDHRVGQRLKGFSVIGSNESIRSSA
jgi:hypothetical protein